jgi:hypothetical protein
MEEEKNQPETPAKFQWVRRRETPEIYSNYMNASWTLFDGRIALGQIVPLDSGGSPEFVVEERAAVIIAWPEAKVIRDALIDLVARYEKANGEIKPLNLPSNKP